MASSNQPESRIHFIIHFCVNSSSLLKLLGNNLNCIKRYRNEGDLQCMFRISDIDFVICFVGENNFTASTWAARAVGQP